MGGGLGDIEEVLAAGRLLARWGYPINLYRDGDRPLPHDIDGPWAWPRTRRVRSLRPTRPRALTLSAAWGTSAAPGRSEPLGRPGAWAAEAGLVESAYGASATLHVSFEEFARTLTSREQEHERRREGGLPVRAIRRALTTSTGRNTIRQAHSAYRKFRAFDRPNVLHWFPTFVRSRSFAREFPEAVQTGPFWPGFVRSRRPRGPRGRSRTGVRTILWYASPGSSPRLGERLAAGVASAGRPVGLEVRTPRPWAPPQAEGLTWRFLPPMAAGAWRRRFESADLRIVTGSRSLLEAVELGRPFLYFNGVLGRGAATRRHRPEKLDSLLRCWALRGASPRWRRDLASVGRLQRVDVIVRHLVERPGWDRGFPDRVEPVGFVPPYQDGRHLLHSMMSRYDGGASAETVVSEARTGTLHASTATTFRGV